MATMPSGAASRVGWRCGRELLRRRKDRDWRNATWHGWHCWRMAKASEGLKRRGGLFGLLDLPQLFGWI